MSSSVCSHTMNKWVGEILKLHCASVLVGTGVGPVGAAAVHPRNTCWVARVVMLNMCAHVCVHECSVHVPRPSMAVIVPSKMGFWACVCGGPKSILWVLLSQSLH